MTSREVVRRAVRFEGAERLPYKLPEKYGTDFLDTYIVDYFKVGKEFDYIDDAAAANGFIDPITP